MREEHGRREGKFGLVFHATKALGPGACLRSVGHAAKRKRTVIKGYHFNSLGTENALAVAFNAAAIHGGINDLPSWDPAGHEETIGFRQAVALWGERRSVKILSGDGISRSTHATTRLDSKVVLYSVLTNIEV